MTETGSTTTIRGGEKTLSIFYYSSGQYIYTMTVNKQKVIMIPYGSTSSEIEPKINSYLDMGWTVVSVTAQHIATGSGSHLTGGYLIVIEKKYDHEEEN